MWKFHYRRWPRSSGTMRQCDDGRALVRAFSDKPESMGFAARLGKNHSRCRRTSCYWQDRRLLSCRRRSASTTLLAYTRQSVDAVAKPRHDGTDHVLHISPSRTILAQPLHSTHPTSGVAARTPGCRWPRVPNAHTAIDAFRHYAPLCRRSLTDTYPSWPGQSPSEAREHRPATTSGPMSHRHRSSGSPLIYRRDPAADALAH
jgi:hypothetical protein